MKVAYADPPYIGLANYYPEKTEVDHLELIARLCRDYDCWALSASSSSLKEILSYCPPDVRIAAWVKPFCSFKPNVNPAYAWEPIVFWHPRSRGRDCPTTRDWLAESMALKKGMIGVKPPRLCFWLFDLLGLELEDTLDDLFPGSGVVTVCWEQWLIMKSGKQISLELEVL